MSNLKNNYMHYSEQHPQYVIIFSIGAIGHHSEFYLAFGICKTGLVVQNTIHTYIRTLMHRSGFSMQ